MTTRHVPCLNLVQMNVSLAYLFFLDHVLPTVLLTGSTDIKLAPWLAVNTIDVIQKCSSYQMCF